VCCQTPALERLAGRIHFRPPEAAAAPGGALALIKEITRRVRVEAEPVAERAFSMGALNGCNRDLIADSVQNG